MFEDPREWTAYRLANEADCAAPDTTESAGAQMLLSVRDAVVEAYEYDKTDDNIAHEAADNAPDVYTNRLWAEFVDLAAYREDPSELDPDPSDLSQCARVCLYLIAERCASAVLDALVSIDNDKEETRQ